MSATQTPTRPLDSARAAQVARGYAAMMLSLGFLGTAAAFLRIAEEYEAQAKETRQ